MVVLAAWLSPVQGTARSFQSNPPVARMYFPITWTAGGSLVQSADVNVGAGAAGFGVAVYDPSDRPHWDLFPSRSTFEISSRGS